MGPGAALTVIVTFALFAMPLGARAQPATPGTPATPVIVIR